MARTKRTIDTEFGPRTFSFTQMFTVNGIRYHVSVANAGNIYTFKMEEQKGVWRIIQSTPPPRSRLDNNT